jgi:hypothetical protein
LPPAADDIAIRLGAMADRTRLNEAAETTFERRGYWGISMFTRPSMDAHALANHAERVMKASPGGKMRATTIGAITSAGLEIKDFREADGHFNLAFSSEPDDATWDAVLAVMAPAQRIEYPEG